MLFSVTVRRSIMSWLARWSIGVRILSVALVMASCTCIDIEVYNDTTSRLHGYGSVLLVMKSPAWVHLMSSRLFSRCAGTSFNIGLRALAVEPGEIGVCGDEALPDKGVEFVL